MKKQRWSVWLKSTIISFVGLQVWSVVWSAGHRQDIYTLCLAHKSCHMAERTDKHFSSNKTLLHVAHPASTHTHSIVFSICIHIVSTLMQTYCMYMHTIMLRHGREHRNTLMHTPVSQSVCGGAYQCSIVWLSDQPLSLKESLSSLSLSNSLPHILSSVCPHYK